MCADACPPGQWDSHPPHADANAHDCQMEEDGSACIRKLPDDIVAQLYLNSDFEGGQFFFEDWEGKRVEIEPTCGKVITFSSGSENIHGVRGVTKGERCMLRTWLTKDATKGKASLPALAMGTSDTKEKSDRSDL